MDLWTRLPSSYDVAVSRLWQELLFKQLGVLANRDFEAALPELSRNYFLATRPWSSQALGKHYSDAFKYLAPNLIKGNISIEQLFTQVAGLTSYDSLYHNSVLAALWEEVCKSQHARGIMRAVAHEFTDKDNLIMEIDGYRVSQDLLNSTLESQFINDSLHQVHGAQSIGRTAPTGGGVIIDFGGGNGRFSRMSFLSGSYSKIICIDIPPALNIQKDKFSSLSAEIELIEGWKLGQDDLTQHLVDLSARPMVIFLFPDQAYELTDLLRCDLFYCNDMIHELTMHSKNEVLRLCSSTAKFSYFSFAEKYELLDQAEPWTMETLGFPKSWKVLKKSHRYWPGDYWQVVFDNRLM